MDIKTKRISKLPQIEAIGEKTNIIVEENGEAKKIPAANMGNGLPEGGAPYQQLVTDGQGVARWEDRTHYEAVETVNEPLNITWDGNTEGLVSVGVDGMQYCKVSDLVLTDEQIKSGTITTSNTGTGQLSTIWDEYMEYDGAITEDIVFLNEVVFVRKDGAIVQDIIFPEAGIYFMNVPDEIYVTALTTTEPVEQLKTVIKTLDPKYLPTGAGIKIAIIKSSDYDNALAGVSTAYDAPEDEITYSCINMTFAEAWETLMKGEPLQAVIMSYDEGDILNELCDCVVLSPAMGAIRCENITSGSAFVWTETGISSVPI